MKRDLRKGEFDPYFGLKVQTDFHIISHMGRGRYMDIIDSYSMVLKTANGRNSQVWFYDFNTKTIKSRKSTSYSIEMTNQGKSNLARIYTTYSRWW
jgi:hypothetical protein